MSWPTMVGHTLGPVTALVGLLPSGALRVACAHEAARRELRAREADVLYTYNMVARKKGRREATSLVCWVAERFRSQVHGAGPGARAAVEPPSAARRAMVGDEVDDEVDGDATEPTRRALGRLRARILQASEGAAAAGEGAGEGGDS